MYKTVDELFEATLINIDDIYIMTSIGECGKWITDKDIREYLHEEALFYSMKSSTKKVLEKLTNLGFIVRDRNPNAATLTKSGYALLNAYEKIVIEKTMSDTCARFGIDIPNE